MSFATPEYSTIKTGILRDIANQLPDAAIGADSDYAVRASGEAAAIEGLYQHQQWLFKQIFPDLADADNLVHHAGLHGITRKPAAIAAGTATFTGIAASAVPIGTACQTANGIQFVTSAAGVIAGGGSVVIAITAVSGGVSGNQLTGTALTLTSPPSGVNTAALIATATTGGADLESDAALLARLLFLLQAPPQGGSKDDYYRWAMAVPGVGYAYIYGQRRAANSVDIVILDSNGALPTTPLIDAVQAVIDVKRPVTADCWVAGPTSVPVAVTATLTLSGVILSDVTPLITASLIAYFKGLKPGDTVIKNKVVTLMLEITGIVDVSISAPSANVTTLVDATHIQLPTLGTVTLS